MRRLGEAVAGAVDLDRLLALARSAPRAAGAGLVAARPAAGAAPPPGARPVVALAGGPGGSYSYPETAELLRAAGAEVVTVDPLRDEALPAGTRALVVGGGAARGVRGGAVRQPPALHRRGRAGPRPAGR